MKVLILCTWYPEFLQSLYAEKPEFACLDYESQRRAILDTGFAVSDAYSFYLNQLGCEAQEVICNADPLQRRWAHEHGLEVSDDRKLSQRQVVEAQVAHYRPDVLFVFEWFPFGDEFLSVIKSTVRLLVGQIASPLRRERTYRSYDLLVSSVPPIVHWGRREGIESEHLRLGFDPRVLDRIAPQSTQFDVTFVGGFAPSHPDRQAWLEELMKEFEVATFGYGVEGLPVHSPIRARHHGAVWGWRMFEVLHGSRITLNRHALIDGRSESNLHYANNMRLYEATGVGTCLLTDGKDNLHEMFEPDRELITYSNTRECVEKIRFYLAHERERQAIAQVGQKRTMREHTYAQRMSELLDMIRRRIG